MKNLEIISKITSFSAIASFIFTAFAATVTYFLILIINQGQEIPMEYLAFTILSNILPYLFIAVLTSIIAVLSRGATDENADKETLPLVETEVNA